MDNIMTHQAMVEKLTYLDQSFPILEFIDSFDAFANRMFPSHWHHELELHLILKGSVEFIINGTSYTVKEKQGIYIAPETIHSLRGLEEETIGYNVVFLPQLFMNLTQTIHSEKFITPFTTHYPDAFHLVPGQKESYAVLNNLKQMYSAESNHPAHELFALEKLIGIWRNLLAVFPPNPTTEEDSNKLLRETRIKVILHYIQQNYTKQITVQDMAAAANISKSECFRCFSLLSRMTPVEYLNQVRLIHAAQLLASTETNIVDICYMSGFNNASYFSQRFREEYGMSPKAYRALNREKRSDEEKEFQDS